MTPLEPKAGGMPSASQSDRVKSPMTPAGLRAICDFLYDKHCSGGQRKLARLLGWGYSTLWRKLNGKSKIIQSDELAVRQVLASFGSITTLCKPET